MSKVVRESARLDQPLQKANIQTLRPRRGEEQSERRFLIEKGPASERITCSNCCHWQAFAERWGRCNGDMVRRHVDGEAPLVTRDAFSCRFFAVGRVADQMDTTGARGRATGRVG